MAGKYYKTRTEAENNRKKYGRIYYEPGEGWYIIYPKRNPFEDIFKF